MLAGLLIATRAQAYSETISDKAQSSEAQKEATLKLYDEVSVENTLVQLSDIARITVDNPELKNRLQSIEIAKAPRVGYFRNINKTRIIALIEKQMPGFYRHLKWEGANSVKVGSVGQIIERDLYVDIAKRELASKVKQVASEFVLTARGVYKDLTVPKGRVSFNAVSEYGKDQSLLKSSMKVWLDISVDNIHYQTVPVWFSVKAYGNALVFNKDLPKGYVVNDRDFITQYINIATARGDRLFGEIPDNKRLKQDVAAGAVLTEDLLQQVPDVASGNTVKVIVEVGDIKLSASAIALEDGFIGEKIKVRKPRSDISYTVTIVGKNKVAADGEG